MKGQQREAKEARQGLQKGRDERDETRLAGLPLSGGEGAACSAAMGVHIPQAQAAVLPSCGDVAAIWQGARSIHLPYMILPQLCGLHTA